MRGTKDSSATDAGSTPFSGIVSAGPGGLRPSAVLLIAVGLLWTFSAQGKELHKAVAEGASCDGDPCCEVYDSRSGDTATLDPRRYWRPMRCNKPPSYRPIPRETKPCERPGYWPYSIASARRPVLVHYRSPYERETALKTLKYLDTAWSFQIDILGFSAPLPDAAYCGPNDAFDVFLWRGHVQCWVDEIAGSPPNTWGGRMSYMLLDPWGKYGGDILRQTIGHELNHSAHATDRWDAPQSAMEMTATYVEQYYGDALGYNVKDFQERPEYSLLWLDLGPDDSMETYFMYGSALYLYFLRDRYFQDEPGFAADLWRALRRDAQGDRLSFGDSLDASLAKKGASFRESAVEFARWRYYVGSRDDGTHFKVWPLPYDQLPFLAESDVKLDGSLTFAGAATSYAIQRPPMVLGSVYVEILASDSDTESFEVSMNAPDVPGAEWVVQAVPGASEASDGDLIDLVGGTARVNFASYGSGRQRTLIFSLIPALSYDPSERDTPDTFPYYYTYPFTIGLKP
jgi:hypothetical protein